MRQFHLGTVLSITTGRLLSPEGRQGVDDLVSYLTGSLILSDDFERVGRRCAEALAVIHPHLAEDALAWSLDRLGALIRLHGNEAGTSLWLQGMVDLFGPSLLINPLPPSLLSEAWEVARA